MPSCNRASVSALWLLLSKEFIVLVGIASLIAAPLALWFMGGWLGNYEYRIRIGWWIPVGAAVLALCIAILTVSAQAVKIATDNPVKHLRSE